MKLRKTILLLNYFAVTIHRHKSIFFVLLPRELPFLKEEKHSLFINLSSIDSSADQ